MENESKIYEKLNQAWKTTSKILLGGDVGDLKEYEHLLSDAISGHLVQKNSTVSKEIVSVPLEYKDLVVARLSEADSIPKLKLDINEIKDIDSIVERLKEEFVYVGDRILGQSAFVDLSTHITDSSYIYQSYNIANSKYIVYSANIRNFSYAFGSMTIGTGSFTILSRNTGGTNTSRMFEVFITIDSSDVYYTTHCTGCRDTFFTFFKDGAHNTIGNLQLPPDKYKQLKATLLEEIRDNLKAKKHVSLFDLFTPEEVERRGQLKKAVLEKLPSIELGEKPFSKESIDKAFKATFKMMFSKELDGSIDDYAGWLTKETPYYNIQVYPSFITGEDVKICPPILGSKWFDKAKEGSLVTKKEAKVIAMLNLSEEEVGQISLKDLEKTKKILSVIYALNERYLHESINYDNSPLIYNSQHVYNSPISTLSKYMGYTVYPRQSAYQFGSALTLHSEFGINVYHSHGVKRGFEVDNSAHSSDIYFSHNCEGSVIA